MGNTDIVQDVELHKHIPGRGLIGNSALGVSDGLVTNLAFLSGLAASAGTLTNLEFIKLAGAASMLAGAISMFFGGYLAGRSEYELYQADARREEQEITEEPEEEKSELKNFYVKKGLSSEEAELVVNRIAANKDKFLEDLLMHEVNVTATKLENPVKVAGVLGFSFLAGALIPLLPFLLFSSGPVALLILATILVSVVFLFIVGGWKALVVGKKFWRGGIETLTIGLVAAMALYLIGALLSIIY
jgi:VIT1/CCC1 family predicted Fe2+/Mn2+ transporter